MRNFSKKLAFVLAAAMVFTAFAPAAKAEAAEEMAINRKSQTLYVNEGINNFDSESLADGLTGNKQEYDFYVANKPADWKTAYTFDWSSSDEKVMTVGKAGLATAVAVGKADVKCVVTEKATGKTTTLTATVTVKANADELVITNAADFDAQTVKAGDEVALEYEMVAEGGKATDLVRWVAEPATGVTVKDGVFTFGEDAVAGDYTLYAEAYQSEKYNATTATSEKIVVTYVADNSFEVEQKTVKTFTVKFDAPVKAVGDVVVNRLYKGFELPALVKTVTLAEDGMNATVEMYSALKNNEEYAINIAGYETVNLTASAGDPVEVLIYVDSKAIGTDAELVSINGTAPAPVELKYVLLDAKGVDVTDVAGGTVLFNAKEYATDGSYYVSGTQMWFAKDGVEIEVTADYQSGRYDNAGNQLAPAKGEKLFYSMEKEPVQVVGLADWKIAGTDAEWKDAKKTVPFGADALLAVKLKLTEGNPVEAVLGSQVPVVGGTIKFEEINPDVAAMSGNEIVYFKQGVAKILVYYVDVEGNELPIAQINAETTAPVALRNIKVEKTVNTVGTVTGYDLLEVKVTAEDNYNGAFLVAGNVSVEGIDNNAKAVVDAGLFDIVYSEDAKTATVQANGAEMLAAVNAVLANDVTTVQLSFKVVVNDAVANKKVEQNFTVLLKSRGAANTEYLQIEATGFGGDVARTEASPNVKDASFTVYQYSNGIKVGTQEIQAYPTDASAITKDAFYFKVTKDGKDITAKVVAQGKSDLAAGKVAFDFSTVTAGVVDYTDFGGGNYAFTLYKGVDVAGKGVAVQQNSSVGVVTCNVGAYSNAVRVKDSLNGALDQDSILAAFTIKDTKGEAATSAFTVDTEVTDKYVFVKSFTFSDDLGNGAVAKYTVNVGIALLK